MTTQKAKFAFAVSPHPAAPGGVGDAVRMHVDDMAAHGWHDGDLVTVTGVARTAGRLVALGASAGRGSVGLAPLLYAGVGAEASGSVSIDAVAPRTAKRAVFAVVERDGNAADRHTGLWDRLFGGERAAEQPIPVVLDARALAGRAVTVGSLVRQDAAILRVIETAPEGAVIIDASTQVTVLDPSDSKTSYKDVGGLSVEVARIREMVELPLRHPEIFARLGVDAPRGLLLYGPPGCGKTLIARAIAQQTNAFFINVNGPEIIQKHYGESEELLRKVFEEAQKHPASILFIDEIDALAPNRETVLGDVEKRVVGQLLALMDGVASRGKVVVMAATNLPNNVDPALRRPGRFDREIAINPPSKAGRLEILKIHTRFMPLAADVELERIATITHGFLGADLAALCREAAMACARQSNVGLPEEVVSKDVLPALFVRMEHFQKALGDFRLSTIRELSSDIAETRWEDIGGLDQPKRLLKEALEWPLVYAARFDHAGARPPKGILLTGKSGTGKTLLAQAVGSSTEVNFIVAKGPELLSKWVGESERGIREVFRRARQSAPSIVFFDEIDAITPSRGKGIGDGQIGDRMVGQFLLDLDTIDAASGVVVLAATNRPDLVDRALLRPGRFDLVIDLPEPDRDGRLAILKVHCRASPIGDDVDLAALADATDDLNGADIAAVCERAKMLAIADSVERQPAQDFTPFTIDRKHFRTALAAIIGTRASLVKKSLDHAA